MKQITKLTPYLFENFLIIAMDSRWIEVFEKIPTFNVYIDDSQRLHIVSQEVIENACGPTKQKKI